MIFYFQNWWDQIPQWIKIFLLSSPSNQLLHEKRLIWKYKNTFINYQKKYFFMPYTAGCNFFNVHNTQITFNEHFLTTSMIMDILPYMHHRSIFFQHGTFLNFLNNLDIICKDFIIIVIVTELFIFFSCFYISVKTEILPQFTLTARVLL